MEVVATDEFADWYTALPEHEKDATYRVVELLRERGVLLRFPQSSDIKGSRYPLRELRYQCDGRPFRVFYAFDPGRDAVLILGGDKTGNNRFYEQMVPKAERIWEQYLEEQGGSRKRQEG